MQVLRSQMLKLRDNGGPSPFSLLHPLLLYTTSSSTHSLTDYLITSLGLSEQQSTSFFAKLKIDPSFDRSLKKATDSDSVHKAKSVVNFLTQNGFDPSQIRHIVYSLPRILRCKIDETLIPKFEFLRDQGLSQSDLVQFVTKNPVLVYKSLNSSTFPAIRALREVLDEDENTIDVIMRFHYNSFNAVAKNLLPNVALLRNYGIPMESIRKCVVQQPRAYSRETKSFTDVLIRVEEKWGIPRDSPMFLYGVNMVSGFSEEGIDSKVEVFRSFGWTQLDIQTIFRTNPNCLRTSKAKIKKVLEYFMTELGYKPAFIASCPTLFICSLEKRIIPRHKILLFVKEKRLITTDYALCKVLKWTEAAFFNKLILPFKEVHQVYTEATGHPVHLLTQAKPDSHSVSSNKQSMVLNAYCKL